MMMMMMMGEWYSGYSALSKRFFVLFLLSIVASGHRGQARAHYAANIRGLPGGLLE